MTELIFILDRSGSMSGLEKDTIGGFNSMIEKQKREDGQALVSTVLFDNESVVIHDRLPLDRVPPLTEGEYHTRGCTALLDAVGGAIHPPQHHEELPPIHRLLHQAPAGPQAGIPRHQPGHPTHVPPPEKRGPYP